MTNEIYEIMQPIEVQSNKYLAIFEELEIVDAVDYERMSEKLKKGSDYLKSVEKQRKTKVKPLNDELKEINSSFKKSTNILEEGLNIARNKMNKYLARVAEENIIKEEQEKKEREEQALIEAQKLEDAKNNNEFDDITKKAFEKTAERKINDLIENTSKVEKTNLGNENTKVSMVWDYEILDIDKIPSQYLKKEVKRKELLTALRNGDTNIDGVRAFQKPQVAVK